MTSFPVADWVAHHARTRPDAVALAGADTGERVSWRELDERVGRTAAGLRAAGLRGARSGGAAGAGDRVAVIADNDPRVFELQFAAMRAGVVVVPLNWRLVVPEMAHQCTDAGVSAILHDDAWAAAAEQVAEAAGVRAVLPLAGLGVGPETMRPAEHHPDTVTHILYTSGTTGRPKGAMVSHRSMFWNAANIVRATQVAAPGVHMLNPMPLFHAGGLNVLANPILLHGGRVTTMVRWDPAAILAYLGDPANGVTHLTTAPPLLQMLVDHPAFPSTDFSCVRKVAIGGGACTPELLRTFAAKGVDLHPQYGGTETGPAALVLEDGLDRAMTGTCGTPVMHTEVRLVDPETHSDVPDGQVGEIWLRGPAVTPGYWRPPGTERALGEREIGTERAPGEREIGTERALGEREIGTEHFVDGWFRTGDAARRDADGYYHVSGRFKDMYKSGGENVYAAEVENVLVDLPEVAEVAIVGVPDPKWGEVGLAVVVPAPGAEVTLERLRAACTGRLARYKHPHRLVITDALDRNVTGKVAKPALRERYRDT